jgi:dihydrodipicolinate synthase/N-acetylneuraminate lyase
MATRFPNAGVFAALFIPTDSRRRVMKRALAAHLTWMQSKGVVGVLALGSTGEFIRFSVDERKAILETVAELAGPLSVIANISDIDPRVSCELGRFARRLKLPGVGIMPPHFFPLSAADQLAFFEHVSAAAALPVMLYNFPELTGKRLSLETIAAFADRAPMAAIKQSGAEFAYHRELIALGREKNFAVFSGADLRLEEVFALGGAGCIGGLVNLVPELMVEIYRVCREGSAGDAPLAGERMRAVGALVNRLTFPLNVAAGVEARGFEPGTPKAIVSKETAQLHREVVVGLRGLFKSWKLPLAGGTQRRS